MNTKRIFLTSSRAVFQWRSLFHRLPQRVQNFNLVEANTNYVISRASSKWHTVARGLSTGTSESDSESDTKTSLGRLKPMMAIQFTCKVCDRRNSKTCTKLAYTKGIVIIKCEGCKNNHLIADNLGWFKHVQGRNIEEILAEKGEEVKRQIEEGTFDIDNQISFTSENK